MAIVEGILATKACLELAKLLMGKLNGPNFDVNDARSKVQEMLLHVVNAQVALGEAQVEISDLRIQLDERDALKVLEADVEFEQDGQFYVRKSERGTNLVRYCPVCWGKDRKLVPLNPYQHPGVFRCAIHESCYWTKVYEEWVGKQPERHISFRPNWMEPR